MKKSGQGSNKDNISIISASRKKKSWPYIAFAVLFVIIIAGGFMIPFKSMEAVLPGQMPASQRTAFDGPVKPLPVSTPANEGAGATDFKEITATPSGQYAAGTVYGEKANPVSENPLLPANPNTGDEQVGSNNSDKTATMLANAEAPGIKGISGNNAPAESYGSINMPAVSEGATEAGSQAHTDVPVLASLVTHNIAFDQDIDFISPYLYSDIDRIAYTLAEHPGATARIVGHTDDIGPEVYNIDLSIRRAAFAKKMLIDRGVAASRIEVSGSGHTQPVASNSYAAGRMKNRRVEITVFSGGQIRRNQFQ